MWLVAGPPAPDCQGHLHRHQPVIRRLGTVVARGFTMTDAAPSPWIWDVAPGLTTQFPYTPSSCYFLGGTKASLSVPNLHL